jgi:hypothetical protein
MHIHIANVNGGIFSTFNIKKPTKFNDHWIELDNTKFNDKLMQCPQAGHKVSSLGGSFGPHCGMLCWPRKQLITCTVRPRLTLPPHAR